MRQVRLIVPLAVCACLPLLAHQPGPAVAGRAAAVVPVRAAQGFMMPLMATVNLVTPPGMRGRVNGLAGAGFSHRHRGGVPALGSGRRPGDSGGGGHLRRRCSGWRWSGWRTAPGRGGAAAHRDPRLPDGPLTRAAPTRTDRTFGPFTGAPPARTSHWSRLCRHPSRVRTPGSPVLMRLARRTLRPLLAAVVTGALVATLTPARRPRPRQ